MSTPVYFFVADRFGVSLMDLPSDLKGMPVVRSKNIAPDMIGDLDFLLTGERTREPESIRDDEDIAVFRLDDELVRALAEVDDDKLDEIADEWGIFDTAGTADLIKSLRELSRSALSDGEAVFLHF